MKLSTKMVVAGTAVIAVGLAWYFFGTEQGKEMRRSWTSSNEEDKNVQNRESNNVREVKDELFEEYLEESMRKIYM